MAECGIELPACGTGVPRADEAPDAPPEGPASGSGVLVINPDLPRHGSRFHEFINTLALAEGFETALVTQTFEADGPAAIADLERHGVRVFAAVHPPAPGTVDGVDAAGAPAGWRGAMMALARRLFHAAIQITPQPPDVLLARRTLRTLAAPLHDALASRRWERIVVVQSQFAEWIGVLPPASARVLVLHDVRTMVRWRAMKTARNPLRRFARLLDTARTWAFERRWIRRFDRVVCLTEVDAALVCRLFGVDRARLDIVPIPVDGGYFRPEPPAAGDGGPVLLFPGRMSHPPNIDAAEWFVEAVFPLVRRRYPEARLVIAGENPPPAVVALGQRHGVTVTGSVPDMRPYFAAASAVVVPLRIGSGARNKILEAWSCGRPVVSTTVGAEGLDAVDGDNLRIADAGAAFAEAVCAILERPDASAALVEGGARAVQRHAPERVGALYRRAVAAAVPAPGPLRAVIDLRWMVPGSAGGLEQTARAFLETLLDLDARTRYTVLLPGSCRWDFDRRARPNFRFISFDTVTNGAARIVAAVRRRLERLSGLPLATPPELRYLRRAATLDAEVALSFAGYINPDLWTLRNALMVPDIQHEYHPEFFSAEALAERRRLFGGSIAHADAICAVSHFTKSTLVERLGVPADRISVAHHAAHARFQDLQPASEAAKRVRHAFGLEAGRYLFFPAHTWHHKNHRAAVEALAILRDRHGLELELVCTGGAREAQPALEALVAERGLGDRVRFLGYVDEDLLPALYQAAAALVFPSRFEGFGIPVVEAMSCGCPVVCSSTSSLPEVADDAALFVDPDDYEGLADAVRRVVTDPDLRAGLIARGHVRARSFSWRAFTLTLIAALQRAAGRQP